MSRTTRLAAPIACKQKRCVQVKRIGNVKTNKSYKRTHVHLFRWNTTTLSHISLLLKAENYAKITNNRLLTIMHVSSLTVNFFFFVHSEMH